MRARDIIRVEDITPRRVTMWRVNAVASRHGKTWDDVVGRDKKTANVIARAAVCDDLRQQGWTLQRIARLIGRDHTTVMNALRKWEAVYKRGRGMDGVVDTTCAVTQRGRAGGALAAPHPALNTTAVKGACNV